MIFLVWHPALPQQWESGVQLCASPGPSLLLHLSVLQPWGQSDLKVVVPSLWFWVCTGVLMLSYCHNQCKVVKISGSAVGEEWQVKSWAEISHSEQSKIV